MQHATGSAVDIFAQHLCRRCVVKGPLRLVSQWHPAMWTGGQSRALSVTHASVASSTFPNAEETTTSPPPTPSRVVPLRLSRMAPKVGFDAEAAVEKPEVHETVSHPDQDGAIARESALQRLSGRHGGDRFWTPATRLLQWGQVQTARHADWTDLFNDLIIVASAFNIGNFLKANLTIFFGQVGHFALTLTVVQSWYTRTLYRARFLADSPAHRLVDTVEGLLWAAASHSIVEDYEKMTSVRMQLFVIFTILARIVHVLKRLELIFFATPNGPKERFGDPRKAARTQLRQVSVEIVLLGAVFFAPTPTLFMVFLLLSWVLTTVIFAAAVFMGKLNRTSMVPIHVEYMSSRMGELIMLMLGEGILSLMISESGVREDENVIFCSFDCWSDRGKAAASFTAAFLLLSSIMFIYCAAHLAPMAAPRCWALTSATAPPPPPLFSPLPSPRPGLWPATGVVALPWREQTSATSSTVLITRRGATQSAAWSGCSPTTS